MAGNHLNLGEGFHAELSGTISAVEGYHKTCVPPRGEYGESVVCAAGVSVIIKGEPEGGRAYPVCPNAESCPNGLPRVIE